jgi:hypothetical protein
MGRELLANPVIEQYEFELNKGVPNYATTGRVKDL